jgi:hypothetical protein
MPIAYARSAGPPEWARWLAGREGAVLYLPAGEPDTQVMLDGVAHWQPLVNGDSGFIPRPYARARELLDGPLGEEALRLLRAIGTRHVVTSTGHPLPLAAQLGADRVYEVPPGDSAAAPAGGPPRPTLWSTEGTVVDVGEVRSVSGIVFELDDRPWQDRPRVEASRDGLEWTPLEARASLAEATLALYRDPRHGRGAVRFPVVTARWLRLDPALPARPGPLGVAP